MMDFVPGFKKSQDVRGDSALTVAAHFDSDTNSDNRLNSLRHVKDLAMQLAKEIMAAAPSCAATAALDDTCLDLIRAACLLHCVGMFINHAGHHKHAEYIVRRAESLAGFRPNEIEVIAKLVRYHRPDKEPPGRKHLEDIPVEYRASFFAMAAIVRMAVALDRRHSCVVSDVRIIVAGHEDECVIAVTARDGRTADISCEIYAAAEELGKFFNAVFEVDARVVQGPISVPFDQAPQSVLDGSRTDMEVSHSHLRP